jgi:hypothetical protein
MFQTLDEQIESTEGVRPTMRARLVRLVGVVMVMAVLIGGLYFAIVSFE